MRRRAVLLGLAMLPAMAQSYNGSNATGQLILTRTVNLLQLAQPATAAQFGPAEGFAPFLRDGFILDTTEEVPEIRRRPALPFSPEAMLGSFAVRSPQNLTVSPQIAGSGFNGLTHMQQRLSNGGNQFSIEPPSPSIAAGNGYILEGVNNAVQVYNESGAALLPQVLSTNQVFGLAPSIDRSTGLYGPFPTDMRVFYDWDINRWFIIQRTLDNDIFRNTLNRSHLYMAVSQTGDPTGNYSIYVMDTTNASNRGCPCYLDFPELGADKYGFYISGNEYDTAYSNPIDARILAISKSSLASSVSLPTMYQFIIPRSSGYEYGIFPATTPPGGSYFTANNGLEYFVSSLLSGGSSLAMWAMSNTASLATSTPSPSFTVRIVSTLIYGPPGVATQRPGPLPYGSTLSPAGRLAYIDGADARVLSVSYAGGRLYATVTTRAVDDFGNPVVGGAYFIFSPTFRSGVLSALPLRQGYLVANNNHLLAPTVAVNAQGRGAVTFTLVGPDYYPSAAFVPIDTLSTGTAIQIAAAGAGPEDGFTGYPGGLGVGIARWGDYSTAVTSTDGSIWMVTEYIPNLPRTQLANWGTFITHYAF